MSGCNCSRAKELAVLADNAWREGQSALRRRFTIDKAKSLRSQELQVQRPISVIMSTIPESAANSEGHQMRHEGAERPRLTHSHPGPTGQPIESPGPTRAAPQPFLAASRPALATSMHEAPHPPPAALSRVPQHPAKLPPFFALPSLPRSHTPHHAPILSPWQALQRARRGLH
jgi:hypothetical protein